ncbi:MAG: HAMP domain-containing histidine kinase, partial [Bacteroidia bacterium]|nr:HAMP domain-containing histidine kinase [Bacteroidia bacterium]
MRGPLASVLGLINLTSCATTSSTRPPTFGPPSNGRIKNLDYTIKQILDHSKNSRVPVYPDVVFLRSLIDDILWQLEYLKNFKKTETRIEIPASMRIISDKYRLTVILQNLMANAFKYHDVSKEQHRIVVQVKQDNESIAITVEDNGIGMNDEVKQRACDMFFRGTNESDGAGLGLYIARESAA